MAALALTMLASCRERASQDSASSRKEADTRKITPLPTAGSRPVKAPGIREEVTKEVETIRRLVESDHDANRREILQAIGRLAEKDPEAALDVFGLLPADFEKWVSTALIGQMAAAHPDVCLKWLSRYKGNGPVDGRVAAALFGSLAVEQPKLALDALAAMNPKQRENIIIGGMPLWINQDAEGALSSVSKILSGSDYETAMGMILYYSALRDPKKTYDSVMQLSPTIRNGAMPHILGQWVNREGFEAVESIVTAAGPEVIQAMAIDSTVLAKMIDANPSLILDALSKMPLKPDTLPRFRNAAIHLGGSSPEAGLLWIQSLPTDSRDPDLFASLFEEWGKVSVDKARDSALNLEGDARTSALGGMGRIAGAKSFEAGFGTISELDATDGMAYLNGMVEGAMRHGAETAIKLLTDDRLPESARSSPENLGKLRDASYKMAASGAEAAAGVALNLTGIQQSAAVEGVVQAWVRTDAAAASEWILNLPPGAARNAGIEVLAKSLDDTDPAAAAEWRKQVSLSGRK